MTTPFIPADPSRPAEGFCYSSSIAIWHGVEYLLLSPVDLRPGIQLLPVIDLSGLDLYQRPDRREQHLFLFQEEGPYTLLLGADGRHIQTTDRELPIEVVPVAAGRGRAEQMRRWTDQVEGEATIAAFMRDGALPPEWEEDAAGEDGAYSLEVLLKALPARTGMSEVALARALGVSVQRLRHWAGIYGVPHEQRADVLRALARLAAPGPPAPERAASRVITDAAAEETDADGRLVGGLASPYLRLYRRGRPGGIDAEVAAASTCPDCGWRGLECRTYRRTQPRTLRVFAVCPACGRADEF